MTTPPVGPGAVRLSPEHLRFPGMSQAVLLNDVLSVSGQVALGNDGLLVGEGDAGAQSHQALANLGAVLDLAGMSAADVVKYTCYLTSAANFEAFARAKVGFFGVHEPAATTVVVAGLLDPRMLVEIDAVALRGRGAGS